MKNNKGFTLIELLVTIAIITLVLGITGYSVIRIINSSKEKSQAISISNVKSAARAYIEEYPVTWTEEENGYYTCISINQLVEKGYLKENQINNIEDINYFTIAKNGAQAITDIDVTNENKCMMINVIEPPICKKLSYKGESQTLIEKKDEENEIENEEETNHKINAGNYKLKVKPKEGKVWKDNTNNEKTITCTIKKGEPEFDFVLDTNDNPEENTIGEKIIKIQSNVDGVINLKSSNPNYVTADFTPIINTEEIQTNEENTNDLNIIEKNKEKNITINKLVTRGNENAEVSTYISITLTPTDSNYLTKTIIYEVGNIKRTKVEKPDSSICSNPGYTGSEQILIKENYLEHKEYVFTNYKGKEPKEYEVIAKLRYGYTWNDDSVDNVIIKCSIKKYKLYIQYNGNGGTWNGDSTKFKVDTNGFVNYQTGYLQDSNPKHIAIKEYREGVLIGSSSGLANYNNKDYISFTKTDYVGLAGAEWCTTKDEKGVCFDQNDATITVDDLAQAKGCAKNEDCTVDLYVNWRKKSATTLAVTFNCNGGTGGGTKTYIKGVSNQKLNATCKKDGYTLEGWSNTANGAKNYNVNASVTDNWITTYTPTKTIYAVWSINVCTIKYSPDGGKFTNNTTNLTQSINYGKATGDMRNANGGYYAATKTGNHPIAGKEWISSLNNATFNQANTYDALKICPDLKTKSQTVTLKVNWELNVCTINFSPNGGKFNKNATDTTYKIKYGNSVSNMRNAKGEDGYYNATRTGYTLVGTTAWISSYQSKIYDQGKGYTAVQLCPNLSSNNQTVTLKANWQAIKPTLTFSPGSGNFATPKNVAITCTSTSKITKFQAHDNTNDYGTTTVNTNTKKSTTITLASTGNRTITASCTAENGASVTKTIKYYIYSTYTGGSSGSSSGGYSGGSSGGGTSTGGCFLAGTKVITINGSKDIDKIKIGDKVLSYNEKKHKNEYKEVLEVYTHPNNIDRLYHITINEKVLDVTASHRFYIKRNNIQKWIPAYKLKVGDMVMYQDNTYHKITNITSSKSIKTVYNINVADNHNYYVGQKGILVHNIKGNYDAIM